MEAVGVELGSRTHSTELVDFRSDRKSKNAMISISAVQTLYKKLIDCHDCQTTQEPSNSHLCGRKKVRFWRTFHHIGTSSYLLDQTSDEPLKSPMNPLSNPLWNPQTRIPSFLQTPLVDYLKDAGLLPKKPADCVFAEAPQLRKLTNGAVTLQRYDADIRGCGCEMRLRSTTSHLSVVSRLTRLH